MTILRRVPRNFPSLSLARLVEWIGGDHTALPPLSENVTFDEGPVLYEGTAVTYILRALPEHTVVDVFWTGDRAAIDTRNLNNKAVWLVRFSDTHIEELSISTSDDDGFLPREKYTTPPPDHLDYLKVLGFREAPGNDELLPPGTRFTDGSIVASLSPAIGQKGYARRGEEVYVLGSRDPLGVQLWALQRGVPAGATRDDRLADLEVITVGCEPRTSNLLLKLAGSPVSVEPGVTLRRVDLWWNAHELWRATVNGWLEWRCTAAR